MFGKLPNGGRVPGGPYRVSQLVLGSVVLIAGWNTKDVWGPSVGSPLTQIVLLVVLTGGATWASGKIPATKRNLFNLTLDGFTAAISPASGTFKGLPVKIARPHYVGGVVLLHFGDAQPGSPEQGLTVTEAPVVGTAGTAEPLLELEAAPAPPATEVVPEEQEELPDNVIPLQPRKTYATGLDRLLDQARRKESN
jgi:hypothetical protein